MRKLMVFGACFLLVGICGAEIITVDDDGPADFSKIQAAINDSNDGDIIEVQPGTYTGNGNRDIDPNGKAITIRSIDPNDPAIVAATVIDCNGTEAEPHRGFNFHNQEDSNSSVEGLTITNGWADKGGGFYLDDSSPIIAKCIISDNTAFWSGGGMYNYLSNPTISSCTFHNNHVFGCLLTGGGGGGMTNWYSSPKVTNCRFIGNSGPCGGGGMANWWPESCPILSNCIFSANTSSGMGNNLDASPILNDCIFIDNSGGGMYGGNPTLTNCIFSRNSTESSGGGIAIWAGSSGSLTLINCVFSGNSAEVSGGAISIEGSNGTTLVNCTLVGNLAHDGSAVACDSFQQMYPSNIQVTNSILWDGGSEIWNNDGSTIIIAYTNIKGGWPGLGNIDTDPCFVESGYWDANETADDANDDFWVDGDYHLKSEGWRWVAPEGNWTWDNVTSRCIDAGNPGSLLGDELLVIPRDPDNLYGRNIRINMGAYGGTDEASMPPYDWAILGDLTNDGKTDFDDLAGQVEDWLNSSGEQPGDLDRNGIIDMVDFALLGKDWLKQTTWHEP